MATIEEQSARCIDKRLERLERCVGELHRTASELEARMSRVMGPPPVNKTDEKEPPKPVMTAIGAVIDAQADEVYAIHRRLSDVLERLGV
jgi:hypothetical protein